MAIAADCNIRIKLIKLKDSKNWMYRSIVHFYYRNPLPQGSVVRVHHLPLGSTKMEYQIPSGVIWLSDEGLANRSNHKNMVFNREHLSL